MRSGVDPIALKAARKRAGLTQSELARRIGVVGGERVSRWELGRSEPRPDLLVAMAEVLDVRSRQLVRPATSVPDLRALRLAAGLDAFEVVEAIHLSLPTYRRWEQGQWSRLPSAGTITALSEVLKASRSEVERAFHSARAEVRERTAPDGADPQS